MNCGNGRWGTGMSSTAQGPSTCDQCGRQKAAAFSSHSQAQGSTGVFRAPWSGLCGTSRHPRGTAPLLAEVDTKRMLDTPGPLGSALQGVCSHLVSRVDDTQANPDRRTMVGQIRARADSAPGQARALCWAPAWTRVSRRPPRAAFPGPER